MTELIVDTDALDGSGQLLAQQGGNSLAQTTDDGVLLSGDDLAALLCCSQNQLIVQRLDGSHIDDHCMDAVLGQLFRSDQCLVDHQAVGNDGNIGAVSQNFTLADLKLEIVTVNNVAQGREMAIQKGVKMGRKVGSIKTLDTLQNEYGHVIKALKRGHSVRNTAKICEVSTSTVQRVKKAFCL